MKQLFLHPRLRLVRGSFAHNVATMFAGTALGQLFSMLLAPLLTRIYPPELFGLLGMFTAAIGIFSVLACLRYEMALPLAQTEADTANLFAVCAVALIGTTLTTCLILLLLPSDWFHELAPYRWLLPPGFFCIGAYQAMIYLATRKGAFPIIARTKIYQGGAGPLSQLALGLAGAGGWGLMIGYVIGQSTGVGLLWSKLVSLTQSLPLVSKAGIRGMASRFRRFPLFSSWSGLLEALGGSYLLLMITPLLYSTTAGGFVFLTDRIIGRPLLLVSTSILQVYIGDMSKSLNTDKTGIRRRFLRLAGLQSMIAGSWLLLVNLVAPTLFPLAFGQEWQGAVPYLQVLSIAYFPQMVMHALIHTLQILERQGLSAAWEAGRLIAVIAVFATAHILGFDALHALLAYSVVQAAAQIALFALMYRSIQSLQRNA